MFDSMPKKESTVMNVIVIICRILVGVLFIISGLIKANDPLGFSYKLAEYFTVFGTEWAKPMALFLSMFICIFEVVCGVATLTGSKAKLNAWGLMLMIVFFTFLTFYSAYFNKVTDCGCFGDALHLTPWQSFTKDVLLLIFITPIFIYRNRIKSVFSNKGDWMIIGASALVMTWFTMYCYNHLPIKDFRPYAKGKSILEGMKVPPGSPTDSFVIDFIYKNPKTGEQVNIASTDLQKKDSIWFATYEYVDRKEKKVREGAVPPIHDFTIRTLDGNTEVTEDVLNNPEYVFLLVAYDIDKTNTKVQPKINEFVKQCQAKGIEFIGLTASPYNKVDPFRHEHQSMFDYYNTDETQLKTMVRSNPGLMLIKQGVVTDMWHYNDLPDFETVNKTYLKK